MHRLVPDDGEVGDGAEVLRDGNRVIEVEHNVPPASRHKHRLTRTLDDLRLTSHAHVQFQIYITIGKITGNLLEKRIGSIDTKHNEETT